MPVALDGLNRAQEAAVTHADGPLAVLAGAGTGKTHTVVHRFAWLVGQGIPPECILALTFSAPAAALLLERLDDLSLRAHEIRGNPAPLLASFVSRIDSLKREMVSAEDMRAHAERQMAAAEGDAARARAARELEFASLYADHDRLL